MSRADVRESSSSVKYPRRFLTPSFSADQPSHVYDLPLTSRRRPKNKRLRDDGHSSTMTSCTNNDGSHSTTNPI
eukprot:scaffold119886_cov76-Cyclotella_meneghiniana.AAC.1